MDNITCIFCDKPGDHIAIIENGYTGYRCAHCNLIFISPRPDVHDIISLYTDKHAVEYADAQFQFNNVNRLSAALTISKLKRYRQSGSILELGPGGGAFLLEARKSGYEPYGIELNPIEFQWIKNNLHIPCDSMPLNANSFSGRQFDIIYHKDVLSHLHDPIREFANINRALKTNGILAFETANIADVSESHYKFFHQFYYPDHLFFFGEQSLNMLLDKTGFTLSRIFRDALLLQMLLEKALWGFRKALRDKRVVGDRNCQNKPDISAPNMSAKRKLRLLYRYVSYCFVRLGIVLPKNGWPLNLLVIAEKRHE